MAVGHVLERDAAELVDVEGVVREDHEVLEMVGLGAGVVREPLQRIVDARRGEMGERVGAARRRHEGAVGDLVVGVLEVGDVEQVAQRDRQRVDRLAVDPLAGRNREVQRNAGRRLADLDGAAVVA